MRSIIFLTVLLISLVNAAVWQNIKRDALEIAEEPRLEARKACPIPTTTVTVLATKIIKTTSTATRTATSYVISTVTATRTIKSTTTYSVTRTYKSTVTTTVTKATTTTSIIFKTKKIYETQTVTDTETATTCPNSSSSTSTLASTTTTNTTSDSTDDDATSSTSTTTDASTTSTSLSTTTTDTATTTTTSDATSTTDLTTTTPSDSTSTSTMSTTDTTSSTTSLSSASDTTTTTTSDSTSVSSTSSATATTSSSGSLPLCSPVKDGSFEQATQSQLDGDGSTVQVAGGWTTLGGFASVTNNGAAYANDGTPNGVIGEGNQAGTSSIWQDLSNLNGVYTLSYYYAVFSVRSGSPCTFEVKLGDNVVDSFQATSDMAVDTNQATIPYTQRTISQPATLSGTARLSFNYVCSDPSTYSMTFIDTVQMSLQNADPGVNCAASADHGGSGSSGNTAASSTMTTTTTTASPLTTSTMTSTTMTTTTTATSEMTTSSTTTSSTTAATTTPVAAFPCDPVLDGSFEEATQDQLDGGSNNGDGNPSVAGAWTSLDTGAVVSANGPTWAHDGAQEGLFYASGVTNSVMYQDLNNLNGIYSFSYWYGVFSITAGSPCTFAVKLGGNVIDSFSITSDMGPDADGNPYWHQRSVAQTPSLSGTVRLEFNYVCTDPATGSGTLFDSVSMQSVSSSDEATCSAS